MAKFKIEGVLRYLSHQETLRLFQRAFARSEIKLDYSQGFNPRPLISLPLPRPVAVQCEEDLLCAGLAGMATDSAEKIETKLGEQLPYGCNLLSVKLAERRISYRPVSAVYLFPLYERVCNDEFNTRVNELIAACRAGEKVMVQRKKDQPAKNRLVNVGRFIDTIELNKNELSVKYRITETGTIRADEIMKLLGIDFSMLSGPIKRANVQWLS